MLERWNVGIMGNMKNVDPTFAFNSDIFRFYCPVLQYSTIPSFREAKKNMATKSTIVQ
jgi:hypothetical protein